MNTHNIPFFNTKKKTTRIIPYLQLWNFFFKGFKNEFERAVVNEPSVFEPFKFYCTFKCTLKHCDCSMKKKNKELLFKLLTLIYLEIG